MRVVGGVSSLILAIAATGAAGGCSKLVGVDLTVVEPCGQEGRTRNGVNSFLLQSTGSTADGAVSFVANDQASIAVGLGDKVTMTLAGFTADITVGANPTQPTAQPVVIGRTMPLSVTESTQDVEATLQLGLVDTFGGPRAADDTCSQLDNGQPVAGRHAHTATFIPVVNKVLIAGGAVFNADGSETFLRTAELYDPATGAFAALPDLPGPRAYHTATALPDGRVVIAGGLSPINQAVSAIISGLIVDVSAVDAPYADIQLGEPRAHHTATLLGDVNMLVLIGGCKGVGCDTESASGTSTSSFGSTVEIIDTATFNITKLPQGVLATPRAMHTAVAFPNGARGLIVVAGGLNANGALKSVELIQVSTNTLANVYSGDDLPTPLVRHQMTKRGEQYLITGGQTSAPGGVLDDTAAPVATVTLCNPVNTAGACTNLENMITPRFGHQAALLVDSQILVVGGYVEGQIVAERFNSAAVPQWSPTGVGRALEARQRATLTMLGGDVGTGAINQLLYTGGHTGLLPYTTRATADLYFGR